MVPDGISLPLRRARRRRPQTATDATFGVGDRRLHHDSERGRCATPQVAKPPRAASNWLVAVLHSPDEPARSIGVHLHHSKGTAPRPFGTSHDGVDGCACSGHGRQPRRRIAAAKAAARTRRRSRRVSRGRPSSGDRRGPGGTRIAQEGSATRSGPGQVTPSSRPRQSCVRSGRRGQRRLPRRRSDPPAPSSAGRLGRRLRP